MLPALFALQALSINTDASAAAADQPALASDAADGSDQDSYMGSYWGVEVYGGATWRAAAAELSPGPTFGLGARFATLMSVIEGRVTLFGGTWREPLDDGSSARLSRLSVGTEVHLHPLFMRHIKGGRWNLFLGSIYGGVGIDLDLVRGRAPAPGGDPGKEEGGAEANFGWHLNGGFDVPITDVNGGWSLWIGLGYRFRLLSADAGLGSLHRAGDFDEHSLFLTLGYRRHRIDFMRVPRPPELNDETPPNNPRPMR